MGSNRRPRALSLRAGIVLCIVFPLASFCVGDTFRQSETAGQLIERVLSNRMSGFRGRARLARTDLQTHKQVSQRLTIKTRQEGKSYKVLYQVAGPASAAGQALLIELEVGQPAKGFLMETPDSVVPLSPKTLARPLFDSDLRIEDLTQDYWHWPRHAFAGSESILGCLCRIIESRPASAAQSSYSMVRSWVCPRLALALRMEWITHEGLPARKLSVEKTAKAGRGWAARSLLITPADGKTSTLLEGTSMEPDVLVPAEEFGIEAIRNDFKRLRKVPG